MCEIFKYIKSNYENWCKGQDSPIMAHDIFKRVISPLIQDSKEPTPGRTK